MSTFSLALTQTPARPATVGPKRFNVASDDDMASPMYTCLELIRLATDLQQESDKDLKFA